jgi:Tfp pilus assembly protein PilF
VIPWIAWALLFAGPLEQGIEAFRRRDFNAAERAFTAAVREKPGDARAHKWLGMVYAAQDDSKRAVEPFARACRLDPREENACYYYGRTLYLVSRFEEALQAFAVAAKNGAPRGRVALGQALALEALGRAAEAEREFAAAIRAGEQRALIDYGMFLFKHGRGPEALVYLKKAKATAEIERVEKALAGAASGTARSAAAISFDRTELDMTVKNGAAGDKRLVETMIAGVAALDFDNDGWSDLFVANGAPLPGLRKTGPEWSDRLFRNNRDGTFTDVTRKAGLEGDGFSMGAAAADYDNDGDADLFVTGVRSSRLYRNLGGGRFEDATASAGLATHRGWSVAAGWFDADNDGDLDLFVVRYVLWDPATESYCGALKAGHRTYCHPSEYRPLPNALYRNDGDVFTDISEASGIAAHAGKGMGVAFGDYDLDGRIDVFIANDTVPNFLFRNKGHGRFEEAALEAGVAYNADGKPLSSMGADLRDFDNDGREDLFVTALTNETFPLFRNLGGRFVDVTHPSRLGAATLPWSGWGTGMFDLNNDGLKDLFTANGHVMDNAELTSSRQSKQANMVFVNLGDGTFRAQTLAGEAFHRGAAFADFNRDGRIDVAVTRLNEKPFLLWNRTAGGHWLRLRLTGSKSNRDAIGARVRVGDQYNRVTTSVGYGGSSEPVVHFGFADARPKPVEIVWPSGAIQKLENVPVDQELAVREN